MFVKSFGAFTLAILCIFSLGVSPVKLTEDIYDKEFVSETVISASYGEEVGFIKGPELEGGFCLKTKNYGNYKNCNLYSEGNLTVDSPRFAVAESTGGAAATNTISVNYAAAINKDGIILDKNTVKDIDTLFRPVFDPESYPLSSYYNFEEENLFIPFPPIMVEEIKMSMEEAKTEAVEATKEALSCIDLKKCDDFFKNCDKLEYTNEKGVVKLSATLFDLYSVFPDFLDTAITEEAREYLGDLDTDFEQLDETTKSILSNSTFEITLTAGHEEKVAFAVSLDVAVSKSDLLSKPISDSFSEEEINLISSINSDIVKIASVSVTSTISFAEEDVKEMREKMSEMERKTRKEILYCQSRTAYEASKTLPLQYVTVQYPKGSPNNIYAEVSYGNQEYISEFRVPLTGMNGYLIENRMYLPLRAICESAGCDVRWDAIERKAYVTRNGKEVYMEGIIKNNRTYVKVRDFEKLGFAVEYDELINIDSVDCLIKLIPQN